MHTYITSCFFIGLQFWTNMKPYSNQLYGPTALPYTVGVTGQKNFIDQRMLVHKLTPGYHTTLHVIPKIIKTTSAFDDLHLDIRQCKLSHETSGFRFFQTYSNTACEIECAARKATSFCQCLPWYYPNNFASYHMCDSFGGYCFDEVMSNIIFYKECKTQCLEDCKEDSLSIWHSSLPLNSDALCKDKTYFDRFFKQNFQRLFALENYQMLIREQSTLDLALRLNNGSLCINYINKYVSLLSVETPTKGVTKSHRDQRKFFIDKLGTIGGTLGVSAGMSVISMIEVVMLLYLILDGIFHDIINNIASFKRKIVSFLNGASTLEPSTSARYTKPSNKDIIENNDLVEDEHEIEKIYVSINPKLFWYSKYNFFQCNKFRS